MDIAECTKILSSRVQKIEPENFTKIIGYLLLNHDEQDIIDYAFGSDEVIQIMISKSKAFLSSARKPNMSNTLAVQTHSDKPVLKRPFLSTPPGFSLGSPYRNQQPLAQNFNRYPRYQSEILSLEEQLQSLKLMGHDYSNNHYHPEALVRAGLGSMAVNGIGIRARSPANVTEFPTRPCHYFQRGFCKHGMNCRYSHVPNIPDDLSPMNGGDMHEVMDDDHVFEPASLAKLEMEIIDLLRARRGMPVSIAALPLYYHDMYGKTLQSEGYLTESQRQGKPGISLTKLLVRLKNVQLIDRPHGQHSVVLTEDVPKYVEYRSARDEPGAILSSSNQIYLTFPADSTFTEEDVADYFKRFGPVCDVRVPRQEKRMFGFVSFLYPETVKLILSKGHPHYIAGARVLVKPYKEKTRQNDKYSEKIEFPMYYPNNYFMAPRTNPFPRVCEPPKLVEHQLLEHDRHTLEFEKRRLCDMWMSAKSQKVVPSYDRMVNELNIPEDGNNALPALKTSSPDDEKNSHSSNSDKDSNYGLPDSPFSLPR